MNSILTPFFASLCLALGQCFSSQYLCTCFYFVHWCFHFSVSSAFKIVYARHKFYLNTNLYLTSFLPTSSLGLPLGHPILIVYIGHFFPQCALSSFKSLLSFQICAFIYGGLNYQSRRWVEHSHRPTVTLPSNCMCSRRRASLKGSGCWWDLCLVYKELMY